MSMLWIKLMNTLQFLKKLKVIAESVFTILLLVMDIVPLI